MTDKIVWASNADPVGELAIKLASTANDLEDEQGEWTWRDIAAAALRTQRDEVVEECAIIVEAGIRLAHDGTDLTGFYGRNHYARGCATAIRNLKSQDEPR